MKLSALVEAILFWKGEPLSFKKLSEMTKKGQVEVEKAVAELEEELSERGVVLLKKGDELMLATKGDASSIIEGLIKEELQKDLGKAGLETLSIVLYLGPISRSEIDYIRGVNSSFIIRNLLIRGLIERIENPNDKRSFIYKPTFDLLSYLGISKVENLPEYVTLKEELLARKTQKEKIDEELKQKSE